MKRALVTYFSITGVTEDVSRRLADIIPADILEIRPEQSVPEQQWQDGTAEEERPSLSFAHHDITPYDVIFVGLPIWWYAAPTMIHTFLEGYDLTGKILVPFATSGGGGVDKIRPRLMVSCPGADLREASLLLGTMTDEELKTWAEPYLL